MTSPELYRVEQCAKRVRTYLGGELVADTRRPLLVWEVPYFPTYFLPEPDITARLVPEPDGGGGSGSGEELTIEVHGTTATRSARRFLDVPGAGGKPMVRIEWDAMDAWFEEDDEVYVHARDPHCRLDFLPSSRHVVVEIAGVRVAESHRPVILFESGLPTRYYLPRTDVRQDLLRRSATTSRCPYKGTAEYYSVLIGEQQHDDVAWSYRYPLPESAAIAGMVSFLNEEADFIVDGIAETRPASIFSRSQTTSDDRSFVAVVTSPP